MTYPKFIVDGDVLIIGKCNRHSQLSFEPENIKGGGFWNITEIDGVKSIVFLVVPLIMAKPLLKI